MKEIKSNFHTHTMRCRHASGTEEDYIQSAIASGLSQLGFSDHAPYPDIDLGRRMLFHELKDYLNEIDSLTAKYQRVITIKKGLEIEYLPEYHDYYDELLTKWKVEYLLMGEHFYINPEGRRTVGSDCHNPAHLWNEAMELAFKNLENLGIRPITDLDV